jgi:hypothetical protein
MDERNDDRPWTEAQWERFMFEADVRAARYGDLLETFHDHPNCEEIVEREMGWDKIEISDEVQEMMAAAELEVEAENEERESLGLDADDDDDLEELNDRSTVPGYAEAFDWGLRMHDKLRPFVELLEEPEPDHPLIIAYGQSLVVAAKIIGGDSMSRHEETMLCANIVCLRPALTAANDSLEALEGAHDRKELPPEVANELLSEGYHVRQLVEAHHRTASPNLVGTAARKRAASFCRCRISTATALACGWSLFNCVARPRGWRGSRRPSACRG